MCIIVVVVTSVYLISDLTLATNSHILAHVVPCLHFSSANSVVGSFVISQPMNEFGQETLSIQNLF